MGGRFVQSSLIRLRIICIRPGVCTGLSFQGEVICVAVPKPLGNTILFQMARSQLPQSPRTVSSTKFPRGKSHTDAFSSV